MLLSFSTTDPTLPPALHLGFLLAWQAYPSYPLSPCQDSLPSQSPLPRPSLWSDFLKGGPGALSPSPLFPLTPLPSFHILSLHLFSRHRPSRSPRIEGPGPPPPCPFSLGRPDLLAWFSNPALCLGVDGPLPCIECQKDEFLFVDPANFVPGPFSRPSL